MASHTDIERLIPWYVNGTLEEADQDRVNEHLEGCAACRALVRSELAFARAISAPLPGMHRIHRIHHRARLLAALPRRRRRLGTAAATAGIVAAVAVVAFIAGHQIGDPAYRTLTTPPPEDRVVLQLSFTPTASEAEVRAVLRMTGGTLSKGPGPGGVYRIALPRHADAPALAQRLRDNPAIRWTEVEAP